MRLVAVMTLLTGCDWVLGLSDVDEPAPHSWYLVEAGDHGTCGITLDQQLYCWGDNSEHQLGVSSDDPQIAPPIAIGGKWTSVVLGTTSGCALDTSGQVSCWGHNIVGQLGTADDLSLISSGPMPVSLPAKVTTLSLSYEHVCALTDGGDIYCWGNNNDGEADPTAPSKAAPPTLVSLPAKGIAIAAGRSHTCAVLADHSLYCWGSNGSGESAQPASGDLAPTLVDGTYLDVQAGRGFSCAIDTDHHAVCWGQNAIGQLGRGSTSGPAFSPSVVSGSAKYDFLAVGDYGACAWDAPTRVDCWGDLAGTGVVATPTRRPEHTWHTMSVGATHQCGIDTVGSLFCRGDGDAGEITPALALTGSAEPVLDGVTEISVGSMSACALANGGMSCWGDNDSGELAVGGYAKIQLEPVAAQDQNFATIDVGTDHACGIDSANHAWCWGNNPAGALGNGNQSGSTSPVSVQASLTRGVIEFSSIACGDQFVVATTPETFATDPHAFYGWGAGTSGQLKDQTTTLIPAFIDRVTTIHYIGVSAGAGFDCVVDTAGLVRCLGVNDQGQLANPDRPEFSGIGGTSLPKFTQVSSGRSHSCALAATGDVYCWGRDYEGEVGNGTHGKIEVATLVSAGTRFTQVALGQYHSCALAIDKTVWCWGDNRHGQLGSAPSAPVGAATQVVGVTADAIEAGGDVTCALSGTSLSCWGDNGNGALGTGSGWTADFIEIAPP
ncbi:MAG: hypothetical protein QM831_06540 [Kofleriaceae bacterium]